MAKVREGVLTNGVSGRVGNAVFAETPQGTIVRARPLRLAKPSSGQLAVQNRMARAAGVYRTLTPAQAETWRGYALGLNPNQAESGINPGPSGQQVFNAYAVKILQVNPNAEVPVDPPADGFPGDGIWITALRTAEGVRFTADGANRAGVVTELLAQRLPSAQCRTYVERYRTQGFHAFTGDGDAVEFTLRPGSWAFAFRFVEAGTGRMSGVWEVGSGE